MDFLAEYLKNPNSANSAIAMLSRVQGDPNLNLVDAAQADANAGIADSFMSGARNGLFNQTEGSDVVKAAFSPLSKTILGKSAAEFVDEGATLQPFLDKKPFAFARSFGLGLGADILDMVQTPASWLGGAIGGEIDGAIGKGAKVASKVKPGAIVDEIAAKFPKINDRYQKMKASKIARDRIAPAEGVQPIKPSKYDPSQEMIDIKGAGESGSNFTNVIKSFPKEHQMYWIDKLKIPKSQKTKLAKELGHLD